MIALLRISARWQILNPSNTSNETQLIRQIVDY